MLPRGLLREYSEWLSFTLRFLDLLVFVGASYLAYYIKFHNMHITTNYIRAIAGTSLIFTVVMHFFQIYKPLANVNFKNYCCSLLQIIFITFTLTTLLAFFTKSGATYSREWVAYWMVLALVALSLLRVIVLFVLRLMRLHGWNERQVILIGASAAGLKLANSMQQSLWTGFRICHIFDDHPETKPATLNGIPVVKTPDDIHQYIINNNLAIDEVWLALPMHEQVRLQEILHALRFQVVTIRYMLDIFGLNRLNHSLTEVAGVPVINICSTPMVGANRLMKAMEDRFFALLILTAIAPLLLIIALAIKLDSKGPVFYRQKRVGWNGKEFAMLKFRTMPVDAEAKTGPVWAKQNENRATKLGKFLRRTSLDELPQFINVLLGDMSIVGPRPERSYFVEQFKEQIPRYMQKHMVKAGITGWAQINGWRGNTDLHKRIEYDLYYIENWSLLFDIKIIFLTFFYGFVNKNAY